MTVERTDSQEVWSRSESGLSRSKLLFRSGEVVVTKSIAESVE